MTRKFIILDIALIIVSLLFLVVKPALVKNAYKSGEEYPRGCSYLRCAKGDQCVNRKFWCKNPPCPSMLYCSKSRKESLKGPTSCESVRCSKGYVCLVRARRCRWDQKCRQQIARCVSEREYYEGATSCADFRCPEGHQCILRESLCARPPCKLLKSCAKFKDVQTWFDVCKRLGCPSEHECFLRKPFEKCSLPPCKHTPDCTSTDDMENDGPGNDYCRGWVCPRMQKCSAHIKEPCKLETCKVTRSCHGHLILPEKHPANRGSSSWKPAKYQPVTVIPTPPSSAWNAETKNRKKTLTKFDRERIQRDHNRRKQLFSTSATIGEAKNTRMKYDLQRFGISRKSKTFDDADSIVSTSTTKGINREKSIHDESDYVMTTIKPTSIIATTLPPETASSGIFRNPEPTLSSLSSWLNHLKMKTGIDAIEQWVQNAQERKDYPQFEEWLKSVKELLGPPIFETWLEEVRSLTQENPEFQEWLPKPSRYHTLDSHHFYDPDTRMADMENEGLISFPGSGNPEGRLSKNSIRKYNQRQRSSSTEINYDNFLSKRKDESERFLSKFPENVVKYDPKFRTAFRLPTSSTTTTTTTTTTTAATTTKSAPRMKDEFPSHRNIQNNSHSQVSSEKSAIYPQKLPIFTTAISWQNENNESTMKFGNIDSKLSNEFEKSTDSHQNLGQPYRDTFRYQQEPEVGQNLSNVPQFLANLNYPYGSFENSIIEPYVQTPIQNGLDYYTNPSRNVDSPDTIVYNVYRSDLQEIPPFTESFQISDYPFSHLPSVFPQDLVRTDYQNFWPAQQVTSYLPRVRAKHSNAHWTFSKYPDFNDMNMAAKSKSLYKEYPFNFGYYGGPGNNFQSENYQYLMHPKFIQDQSIRNSRNLLLPKFTSFPYESPFNIQNTVAPRYMSLLGYVPQIPVDEKEQALTTYALSRDPLEMNPFEKYPRPSINIEEMNNPKMISPYNAYLDKQIFENTEIGLEDTRKMDQQYLQQKYQGSLERPDPKGNHPTNTWEEPEYRIPEEILTENKPKIPDRSWEFPERQKVPQDRKTVVTSYPKSYKGISDDRMSDVDRSYYTDKNDYVRRNDREFSKRMKSFPTEETEIPNEYSTEVEHSTIPNIYQQQHSDNIPDEYTENLENTPQDRDIETLSEMLKNIATTIATDKSDDATPLKLWKNDGRDDSLNYEVADENLENYSENPNFEETTDYTGDEARRYSRLKNNSNHVFHALSDLQFFDNHFNDNKNDTIYSEVTTIAKNPKKNIFKNERYEGYSDFPDNLKPVYSGPNNIELKRLFETSTVPRSSDESQTIENMRKSKSKSNDDYEDEERRVDYSEIDKDDQLAQFVPKPSQSNSKIQNVQKDDIDYTRQNYEEEEYNVPEDEDQQNERYRGKRGEE